MTDRREQTDSSTSRPVVEPKPPFPEQHHQSPGLESELDPSPRWKGARYKPSGKLTGQVALITGGDSGIGRAVAYFFAREGADVMITCLPEERSDAEVVQQAIRALGRCCHIHPGDLRESAFCDEVVLKTLDDFGRLDILVHNAAWQNRKEIASLSEDELDTTLKVNVYAYLRLARAAAPHMRPGGSVIATGSVVGLNGSERLADYGASKGAIHSITRCLARELLEKQIRVNCVAPGPVWTPLNPSDSGLSASEVAEFGRQTGKSPMKRPAQPEEIAPAYVYFASNADSSFVTGVVLPITGGEV